MSANLTRLEEHARAFAELHKKCNETRQNGLPWDRLRHVLDALISLVKLVVAYRAERNLTSTQNVCDDRSNWPLWIAAECEVKDLRELATRELPEVMLPVEASAIDRLEDLLRFMLYGPWRDEAPQEVEEYLWKLERRWNSMWRRLHSTPLANGTNPPPAEANAAEGGKPGTVAKPESPADPFAELRQFARTELKGQERAVIEALCDAAGELPLTDVKALCNWQDPIESAWNSLRMRTNKKLELQGWKVITRGRSARLTKPDPE